VHVVPPLGMLPTVHDPPELEPDPELELLADPELEPDDPELEPDDAPLDEPVLPGPVPLDEAVVPEDVPLDEAVLPEPVPLDDAVLPEVLPLDEAVLPDEALPPDDALPDEDAVLPEVDPPELDAEPLVIGEGPSVDDEHATNATTAAVGNTNERALITGTLLFSSRGAS
jgi:S-DNA-T family DNA segregation ATPase FtsK/SpoIIIE